MLDESIKEVHGEITRKDALIKVGKYAAVRAAVPIGNLTSDTEHFLFMKILLNEC